MQWRSQNVFMLSLIWEKRSLPLYYSKSIWVMNVELPETLVLIESIVYKSNGFAIATSR
jgi:hypothetical protein